MIKPEQLKTYFQIQSEVLGILQNYVELHNSIFVENKLHRPFDIGEIHEDSLYWEGTDTWNYGGYESWHHRVPIEILFMTQDQWAININRDRELFLQEQKERILREDQRIKAEKEKQFLKLKEELGK